MANIIKAIHLTHDTSSFIVVDASGEINVSDFAHEIADHMASIAPANCEVLYFNSKERREVLEHHSTNRFWFERRLEQRQTGLYDYNTDGRDDINQFPAGPYQQETKKYQDFVRGRITCFAENEPQTVETIKRYILQRVESGKRPVVIIDSIENLVCASARNPVEANEVIRSLKSIQEKYGILLIAVRDVIEMHYKQSITQAVKNYADYIWRLEVATTNPEVIPGKYISREYPWLVTLKALKASTDIESYSASFEYCYYYRCFDPYVPVR